MKLTARPQRIECIDNGCGHGTHNVRDSHLTEHKRFGIRYLTVIGLSASPKQAPLSPGPNRIPFPNLSTCTVRLSQFAHGRCMRIHKVTGQVCVGNEGS
jgi:hypothetical protein